MIEKQVFQDKTNLKEKKTVITESFKTGMQKLCNAIEMHDFKCVQEWTEECL